MSESETPAALLRRAAELMRKRAEAAMCGGMCRSPWRVGERDSCDCCEFVRDATGSLIAKADDRQTAHIASWHPGVALAVADWLDRFAVMTYCYGPAEFDHAVAIARAYLNEPAETASA